MRSAWAVLMLVLAGCGLKPSQVSLIPLATLSGDAGFTPRQVAIGSMHLHDDTCPFQNGAVVLIEDRCGSEVHTVEVGVWLLPDGGVPTGALPIEGTDCNPEPTSTVDIIEQPGQAPVFASAGTVTITGSAQTPAGLGLKGSFHAVFPKTSGGESPTLDGTFDGTQGVRCFAQ